MRHGFQNQNIILNRMKYILHEELSSFFQKPWNNLVDTGCYIAHSNFDIDFDAILLVPFWIRMQADQTLNAMPWPTGKWKLTKGARWHDVILTRNSMHIYMQNQMNTPATSLVAPSIRPKQ